MENQTTTTRTALKWGVIIGIISMLYSTAYLVAGQIGNQALSYPIYVVIGVGIYLAMNEFKKENQGFMSYGQGLGLGTLMSAISGLISSFFSMAYMKFIDPTITDQIMKKAVEDMEKKGIPDEQIDQAMEMSKIFMNPGAMFIFGLFGSILIGFILSLIIAAIVKKDKSVFE
ncbi:MAG: DUF4199 domain-containing protein [Arcicella sp.]|nr:DUF4199 domain-containing protein [Arcicella sp.]